MIKLVQDWRFLHTAAVDSDVRKVVLDDEIIGDCIRYVVSHEVGHCLALMHNMSASAAIPVDSFSIFYAKVRYDLFHYGLCSE